MQAQNNSQPTFVFTCVDDSRCDVESDSILRSKPPNLPGFKSTLRESLSCSCLLNIDQYTNNQEYCADTVSQEIQYNSSTRDITAFYTPRTNPSSEIHSGAAKSVSESPKKAERRTGRFRRGLCILGRPFAQMGAGLGHLMDILMDSVPDLVDEFHK